MLIFIDILWHNVVGSANQINIAEKHHCDLKKTSPPSKK